MHESMCDLNCGLRPEAREKQVNAMIETKTREREREREREERERERAMPSIDLEHLEAAEAMERKK